MFPVAELAAAFSSLRLGTQFTLLVAVPSVAALFAGKVIFLPDERLRTIASEFVRTDWRYLGVA